MKKRKIKKEQDQFYEKCTKCGTEIKGSSEAMVKGNMKFHMNSKRCKK